MFDLASASFQLFYLLSIFKVYLLKAWFLSHFNFFYPTLKLLIEKITGFCQIDLIQGNIMLTFGTKAGNSTDSSGREVQRH